MPHAFLWDTVPLHGLGELLGEHHSTRGKLLLAISMGHTFHLITSSSAARSLLFPHSCFPTPCKNETTVGVLEADPTILHLSFVDGYVVAQKPAK